MINKRKRNFILGMILVVAYLAAFLITQPVESKPAKQYPVGWIECFQMKNGVMYCPDGRFKPDTK